MAECLVLGAGMVGISTALALQAQGHAVRVIDRRDPGQETSFGNAGVIQAEAHEPYAIPRNPVTLWRYATGQSNDVLLDWTALPGQAGALWRYFHNSAPARHRAIAAVYSRLVQDATTDHAPLITASSSEALLRKTGIGEVYDSAAGLERAATEAERTRDRYGLGMRVVQGPELTAEDPALHGATAGAVVWTDSWSLRDPGALVAAYGALFTARGGGIDTGEVTGLARDTTGWTVTLQGGQTCRAAHVVVALGPWSPGLLAQVGCRVPMVHKRGYHTHYAMAGTLNRPYLLADHGVVVSSMADGLRITTGAHLTRHGAPQSLRQLHKGHAAAARLMDLGAQVPGPVWHGTRPCLPDMLPRVGPVPGHPGLWQNFGHGHQGFTLGPTTGRLLAEAIDGRDDDLIRKLARLDAVT